MAALCTLIADETAQLALVSRFRSHADRLVARIKGESNEKMQKFYYRQLEAICRHMAPVEVPPSLDAILESKTTQYADLQDVKLGGAV